MQSFFCLIIVLFLRPNEILDFDILKTSPATANWTIVHQAFNFYKSGKRNETIMILEESGFMLVRNWEVALVPEGQADSLIFIKRDTDTLEIMFHTIDLKYNKWIDASIAIKSSDYAKSIQSIIKLFTDEGLKGEWAHCDIDFCYLFQDQQEIWVVDKRWKKFNYERYTSLYKHQIHVNEDFVWIYLTETIPRFVVTPEEVPISAK